MRIRQFNGGVPKPAPFQVKRAVHRHPKRYNDFERMIEFFIPRSWLGQVDYIWVTHNRRKITASLIEVEGFKKHKVQQDGRVTQNALSPLPLLRRKTVGARTILNKPWLLSIPLEV
jgi:hypothetical protein